MTRTIILCVIMLAIAHIFLNYIRIRKMKEGTREMVEMAGSIRSGVSIFLKTEHKTISVVVILLAIPGRELLNERSMTEFQISDGLHSQRAARSLCEERQFMPEILQFMTETRQNRGINNAHFAKNA